MTLPCTQCGKPHEVMRAEHEKKLRRGQTNRFCSHACVAVSLSARAKGRDCPQCGGRIENDNGRRYCTPACRVAARKPSPSTTCPTCSTTFTPKNTRREFCSRPCANAAHAKRMTGMGNSRYRDGTSYADWFRSMRPLIFERDGGVCRACQQVAPPLRYKRLGKWVERSLMLVHHIDHDPRNNLPGNLILLCQQCHGIHHKSARTPFPWFAEYAAQASRSMTSKWKATATSLRERYSSTTA